jgi:hypothetical protein
MKAGYQYYQGSMLAQLVCNNSGKWYFRCSQGGGFGAWTWVLPPNIKQGCLHQGSGKVVALVALKQEPANLPQK